MANSFLSRVFQTVGQSPFVSSQNLHLPMINEITNSLSTFLNAVSQIRKKKALMVWYKTIPELTALANKVAKDIVYKWHFEPFNPSESGRNKVMAANKFSIEVGMRRQRMSEVLDTLVTGDGFGWKGKLTDKQVKDAIKKTISKFRFLERKTKDECRKRLYMELKRTEGFADSDGIDEDLLKPRKYRYVASTTIEIIHDEVDALARKVFNERPAVQPIVAPEEGLLPPEVVPTPEENFTRFLERTVKKAEMESAGQAILFGCFKPA